ncbi:hypothetical protein V496_06191 [Pseudogymnoascus sp. VKM F-4515 (FW-2607)]|nr:hypothetical protein V496_06191 [Pseudogymnoascus sp. VKM F-4515 (FW-2607)]KFY94246.1 hypothetical protein V498_03988 [Pseudogymnoascus sp. VKM F-4517 (FW-2822)]
MTSPLSISLRALRQTNTRRSVTSFRRAFASSPPPPPAGDTPKPVSAHVDFYKTFARPIAKVLLLATFTYQLSYYFWVKLEKDEIKSERQNEILQLENQLQAALEKPKQP